MKFIILLLTVICVVQACNKIACGTLIAGCAGSCLCDLPACECCPICAVCLGSMWSTCCDCFSSDCGNDSLNKTLAEAMKHDEPIEYLIEKLKNVSDSYCHCGDYCSVDCPSGQTAWCVDCIYEGGPTCVCSDSNPCKKNYDEC